MILFYARRIRQPNLVDRTGTNAHVVLLVKKKKTISLKYIVTMCIIPPTAAKDSVAALDKSPCKTLLLSTSLGDILSSPSPSSLCYELCDSRRKSGCYRRSDCIICSVTISGTTDIIVSYQSMLGDCVRCNRVRCAAVTSGSGRR